MRASLVISVLAIFFVLFFSFNGKVHLFDWDEINFAEIAREMIVTGNYLDVQIDYKPFWEKPPFFAWLQVLSMKIFGINEFAARFPNAIAGLLSLLLIFYIGKKLHHIRFGFLWMLILGCSTLPFFYFKSGIIDPWYNLLIYASGFYIFQYLNTGKIYHALLGGFLCGLSILTKGPVGLLILGFVLILYGLFQKQIWPKIFRHQFLLGFVLTMFVTGSSWFILQIANGEYQMVKDFIFYQIRLLSTADAGHAGPWYYHLVVLLVGVFPASLIAIPSFFRQGEADLLDFKKWNMLMLIVVLIIFSIVKTKIIHYSSLAFFPITYLAAVQILGWLKGINHTYKYLTPLIIVFIALFIVANVLITQFEYIKHYIINNITIEDTFAIANIKAQVDWQGYEIISCVFLITALIGWLIFRNRNIRYAIFSLFIGNLAFVYTTMLFVVPKVEKYTQGAAIEFYKSLRSQNVYITPLYFKTYAYLFYSDKRPFTQKSNLELQHLLEGKIDYPAYFVLKNNDRTKVENYPITFLYEKNGFLFFKRNPEAIID
ncbi:MAG: glycosyltransferase family 39 protein [Bacteroidales bacterium]|nr:glycosyltransferase family 39 protein [Bacteroidales bacterium]